MATTRRKAPAAAGPGPARRGARPPPRPLDPAQRRIKKDSHVYIYIYIYIYTHTYIYIYIHMCVCVCQAKPLRRDKLLEGTRKGHLDRYPYIMNLHIVHMVTTPMNYLCSQGLKSCKHRKNEKQDRVLMCWCHKNDA